MAKDEKRKRVAGTNDEEAMGKQAQKQPTKQIEKVEYLRTRQRYTDMTPMRTRNVRSS